MINAEEINTSISIVELVLDISPHEECIVLREFNPHHESWGGSEVSTTYREKSEELLILMQRREIEQMLPVVATTYKESSGKSIIDLVFATPLF